MSGWDTEASNTLSIRCDEGTFPLHVFFFLRCLPSRRRRIGRELPPKKIKRTRNKEKKKRRTGRTRIVDAKFETRVPTRRSVYRHRERMRRVGFRRDEILPDNHVSLDLRRHPTLRTERTSQRARCSNGGGKRESQDAEERVRTRRNECGTERIGLVPSKQHVERFIPSLRRISLPSTSSPIPSPIDSSRCL